MTRQILWLHWKAGRLALLPFVLAAFGLPLLVVQGWGPASNGAEAMRATGVVAAMGFWEPLFPALAALVGSVVALTAWSWDQQAGHVYALTLPLARWRYVLLKMGGGAALLLLPAAALLLGSLVATAAVDLPLGLRAYPLAVTFRFLAASTVAYALLFSMAAGSIRTTLWVITGAIVFLVVGSAAADALTSMGVLPGDFSLPETVGRMLSAPAGPLHVFAGHWRLFDV